MELAASSIIGPENAILVDSTFTAATSEVPTAVTTVELSPLLTDTSQNFSGTPTAQAFPTVNLALPSIPLPTVTEMYLDQMISTPFPTLPILGPSMPTVVAPDEVLPTPTMEFPIVPRRSTTAWIRCRRIGKSQGCGRSMLLVRITGLGLAGGPVEVLRTFCIGRSRFDLRGMFQMLTCSSVPGFLGKISVKRGSQRDRKSMGTCLFGHARNRLAVRRY